MTDRIPAALLSRRCDQTVVAGWRDPAMQRISDALLSGLSWYVPGRLALEKAARLVTKMQAHFPQLTRDRRHAHRQKLAGEPRYKLVVFANRPGGEALFWLLTDRPADPREKWRHAVGAERLTCYDYEAVRHTRGNSDSPAWTWQLRPERFKKLKDEITSSVRRATKPCTAASVGLEARTWAGFAGVRKQHAQLERIYRHEWKRKHGNTEPEPWPRLGYVQRLKTR